MKVLALVGLLTLTSSCASSDSVSDPIDPAAAPEQSMRIGTYDTRAIAVAYAPSAFNPVSEKMAEHAAAKAAGDDALVLELEAWGEGHQRQLHRQAFARVPVDDLLAYVADRMPDLAKGLGVAAIVSDCTFVAPGVETVDVTMELVDLFDPSDRTRTTVRAVLEKDPIDLDTVEAGQDH